MNNNDNILTGIPHLAMKRAATESIINGIIPLETIADRIILLLEGDDNKLNMLFTGVPIDFLNAEERLKAEEICSKIFGHSGSSIRNMEFDKNHSLKVTYTYPDSRFIRPGDEEARKLVETGKYCADSRWCRDSEFSEEVKIEQITFENINVSALMQKGIRFECV